MLDVVELCIFSVVIFLGYFIDIIQFGRKNTHIDTHKRWWYMIWKDWRECICYVRKSSPYLQYLLLSCHIRVSYRKKYWLECSDLVKYLNEYIKLSTQYRSRLIWCSRELVLGNVNIHDKLYRVVYREISWK